MIGITNTGDLENALIYRRGKIVGILFCTYRGEDQSVNGTWARSFDDWNLYSAHDIDILASGYACHGVQPADPQDFILVRDLDRGMKLWYSREALFSCADLVIKKTDHRWHYSGELDLIFVRVGELGIDWGGIASVDVGMLVRDGIYPTVDRFVFELISAFKESQLFEVSVLYRKLVGLPTIQSYAGAAAKAAPKIIADALKLVVGGH